GLLSGPDLNTLQAYPLIQCRRKTRPLFFDKHISMTKLIVANWKLNPATLKEAQKLVAALGKVKAKQKVVLCPPFVYLSALKTKYDLGAQDLFWEESGAYTGQVSGTLLKQFKVKYAIVGHSEKRAVGDTDNEIN